jgi:hypothetical protein
MEAQIKLQNAEANHADVVRKYREQHEFADELRAESKKLRRDCEIMYDAICDAYQLAGRATINPDATDEDEIRLLDHLAQLAERFDQYFVEEE